MNESTILVTGYTGHGYKKVASELAENAGRQTWTYAPVEDAELAEFLADGTVVYGTPNYNEFQRLKSLAVTEGIGLVTVFISSLETTEVAMRDRNSGYTLLPHDCDIHLDISSISPSGVQEVVVQAITEALRNDLQMSLDIAQPMERLL